MLRLITALFGLLLWFVVPSTLTAQVFGRNKPNYENFDFKVYQSPHFEMYTYINNPEYIRDFLHDSEEWYLSHQRILQDTILGRNPMIIYANHADFQQTNAISGAISTGTGGVTEAFKNRVILPIAMSNQQTHHVLGHELVHAFQYNMILNGDSTSLRNLGNLPLWMVEGLAEYLSIGSVDAHTAMWLRDAVLQNDVPSLKDLNSGRYFPYRYGQAFWAFVTGLYGDDIIPRYFENTAKIGIEAATLLTLGVKYDDLSNLWVQGIRKTYTPYILGKDAPDVEFGLVSSTTDDKRKRKQQDSDRGKPITKERFVGKELISSKKDGGRLNVAPEISPDGRYIIFLSEKDLFSIDLFLANARTGEIIRKVASTTRAGHIDDFNYIESSGTWSPDGDRFATVAVSRGDNLLVINDTESGRTVEEIRLPEVPAFMNPAWSPDGRTIVVSGLVEGQVDLYSYDLRSGRVTQLTNDRYSELHPAWSADGSKIYFSSDELSLRNNRRINGSLNFNLAYLDIVSGVAEQLDVFPGADNLNPEEDPNGNIIFLSNRDGFRNIYRYEPATREVYQLTDLLTGVSGITHYAPAISIDRKRNRLVYTYFSQRGYDIYQADASEMLEKRVDSQTTDFTPAQLPRLNRQVSSTVDQQINDLTVGVQDETVAVQTVDYKPKFKLDYIGGGAGVGVGNNATFGNTTGIAGGVDMLFSDILGNNQFFSTLSLNGEISDFGGRLGYINRSSRLNWGGSLSLIPYRSLLDFPSNQLDTVNLGGQAVLSVRNDANILRIFENRASLFAQYPFTSTLRVEAGATYALYGTRVDRYSTFYQAFPNGRGGFFAGNFLGQERNRVRENEPEGFGFGTVEAALVGDNSNFGLTAPIMGSRFRFAAEQNFGDFAFTGLTADYRRYFFLRPVTLAMRGWHYGRYGGNSESLFPLFVGSPWFVRGLTSAQGDQDFRSSGRSYSELFGTRFLVGNLELRIPFTGPRQLALIKSGLLFSDLNFFLDGGMAWTRNSQFTEPVFRLDQNGEPLMNPETGELLVDYPKARPIFTTGVSLRVNLFGALIVEPFYAMPLVEGGGFNFGINLLPGW